MGGGGDGWVGVSCEEFGVDNGGGGGGGGIGPLDPPPVHKNVRHLCGQTAHTTSLIRHQTSDLIHIAATASYKERYEGTSGSSSTSGSQKESDVRLEEGLSEAGKRLKKAMRRRFKIIDGEEFFEIHKNEWVRTTEDPVGPCKTCKARGEVTRHWVWRCPFLE